MFFQQIADGGCQSYVVGCRTTCSAVIIDPALGQADRYVGIANREGLRVRHIIETHTHADHFSAARLLRERLGASVVMHRNSNAPHVDMHVEDGHLVVIGELRLRILHTPGHTRDSMCVHVEDRVFTGDTLLIGGPGGRTSPQAIPTHCTTACSASCCTLTAKHSSFPPMIISSAAIPRSPPNWRTTPGSRSGIARPSSR